MSRFVVVNKHTNLVICAFRSKKGIASPLKEGRRP